MAIETICRGCARKLRVGDEFAGRKARCPHCKTIYTVPAATVGGDSTPEPAADDSDNWLMRTADGADYGPVSKSEMDRWVREGRIDATSQLRQEGEATWRPAAKVYPSLQAAASPAVNPFSRESTSPAQAASPYAAPHVAGHMGRPFRPHRGVMILIFGLAGILCCQVFSIVAWVMGHADLKEIDAGRMDSEGRGLTQAGMIVGIIGTVLMVLGIFAQVIMVLIMVANA